ncbi:MAG: sugar ABC transporter permease, partial [Chloroflexi bacterium]|nr:sugar ABC transporter permease [Chloroflexota bacterium]
MAQTATTPTQSTRVAMRARARERPHVDWIAYAYLLPALLIITVFHILPVGYALWISLQGGRIRNFRFIGLDNYLNALNAPEFWGALQNTVFYVIGTVP